MLVTCKHTLGSAIPSSMRHLGETDQTNYSPLKVGENYLVVSILMIKDRLDYLVAPNDGAPLWAPSQLFELIDKKIPGGWAVCETKNSVEYAPLLQGFGISHIFGYAALTQDYQHYVGLIERDVEALRIFNREKKTLEELID
ncbi:hypothetical protein ACIPRI_12505 [Variovorax sp. LARHSF232]